MLTGGYPVVLNDTLYDVNVEERSTIVLTLEDYDDQDIFNNFSGDWNKFETGQASVNWSFDTNECRVGRGACLKVGYNVSRDFGGLWNSLWGKVDFLNHHVNFLDLYGDLKNSSGNPTQVEDVEVTQFGFWAKGNGIGDFNHIINVEFKDTKGNTTSEKFSIPNTSEWKEYIFPVSNMGGIDLTSVKELVFVVADFENSNRTSQFYLDDLTLTTTEEAYDMTEWPDSVFLDAVSQRAFKYFITYTDELGFVLDRSTFSDLVSVGAIGYQLTAYSIGYKRGWADGLEDRVESILVNLSNLKMGPEAGTMNAGYRGFFYHFLEANKGHRKDDNVELSLYDTMLLMYGVLTSIEMFPENPTIQAVGKQLYDAVEWDWFVDNEPGENQYRFWLGWKPESGFDPHHLDGYTDEATLVDVLALGSETHPVTMDTYHARTRARGRNIGTYLPGGEEIVVAWTGSLFNYFFASGWLDFQHRGTDAHATFPVDLWENNKRAIRASYEFSIAQQDDVKWDGDDKFTTYGSRSWGLTACDNLVNPESGLLSAYYAFGAMPTEQNICCGGDAKQVGTIPVYGAGSSIMYLPEEAIGALRHYYTIPGLWSPLIGLGDAYSEDPHTFEELNDGSLKVEPATWLNTIWVNKMVMAINQGPMLLGIENYRSGLIWKLTNQNAALQRGLDRIYGVGDPNEVEVQWQVNKRWNMIGNPVEVGDAHYKTLFPDAREGTLRGFDNGYFYPDPPELKSCTGYWIAFNNATTASVIGEIIPTCRMSLNPGWNLISGPTCSVKMNDFNDPNGILVKSSLIGYDRGYYLARRLMPGIGYWVLARGRGEVSVECEEANKSTQNNQLILSSLAEPSVQKEDFLAAHSYEPEEIGRLRITNSEGIQGDLFFGNTEFIQAEQLELTMPPRPEDDLFDVRFENNQWFSSEMQMPILIQGAGYSSEIEVLNTPQSGEYDLEIKRSNGLTVYESLDTGVVYSINSGDLVRLIKVSSSDQLRVLPEQVALDNNYPNPFTSLTTIRYSIPEELLVRIDLYDMLGRHIRTLTNELHDAGWHEVVLDGDDLASGTYVYRMQAGETIEQKTMIVNK